MIIFIPPKKIKIQQITNKIFWLNLSNIIPATTEPIGLPKELAVRIVVITRPSISSVLVICIKDSPKMLWIPVKVPKILIRKQNISQLELFIKNKRGIILKIQISPTFFEVVFKYLQIITPTINPKKKDI